MCCVVEIVVENMKVSSVSSSSYCSKLAHSARKCVYQSFYCVCVFSFNVNELLSMLVLDILNGY